MNEHQLTLKALVRVETGWLLRFAGNKDDFTTLVTLLKEEYKNPANAGTPSVFWASDVLAGQGAWFLDLSMLPKFADHFSNLEEMRVVAEEEYRKRKEAERDSQEIQKRTIIQFTLEQAYGVLGLPPGASLEAVQSSYRNLAKRVHPDHGGTHMLMVLLNIAYEGCIARCEKAGDA